MFNVVLQVANVEGKDRQSRKAAQQVLLTAITLKCDLQKEEKHTIQG